MSIEYGDKLKGWWIERDENNMLFFYFFDPAMGGEKCRVEIGEDELNFALKVNPKRDEMAAYIAANRTRNSGS